MGQPLTQPKWFKPGARTTLNPFGQRNSAPSSPYLNLMDFGIWSILERKACAVSHSNVKKLKKLKESWAKIESETFRATCDQVISCLRHAIIEKGRYIEQTEFNIEDYTFTFNFLQKKISLPFSFLN